MSRYFNDRGVCIPERHFMADVSGKMVRIFELIERGDYFTINRPRQYGKTTILSLIEQKLKALSEYKVINLSFESIDSESYQNRQNFIEAFLYQINKYAQNTDDNSLKEIIAPYKETGSFQDLDQLITEITRNQKVVLLIDEVDKSSNNQLFLDFLALLRNKFLEWSQGRGSTFQCVVLAGVHDVKHLSSWNIAVELDVDLSLNRDEIAGMLHEYCMEKNVQMDVTSIADRLFYHTSGYPFLVGRVCKIVDEIIKPEGNWQLKQIDQALPILLKEDIKYFESLLTNLESNKELYALTEALIFKEKRILFNSANSVMKAGGVHGIFLKTGFLQIHNRIYEQYLHNHMSNKLKVAQ